FVYSARRDLVGASQPAPAGGRALWATGLGLALLLAAVSPLASSHPDGLDWVAEQQGFLALARGPLYEIMPGYGYPGIPIEALATILAGVLGTLIVFGVALSVAMVRKGRGAS